MYTYFSWIFRHIVTLYLVYYHSLVGIYRDVTLSPVRVLHCVLSIDVKWKVGTETMRI